MSNSAVLKSSIAKKWWMALTGLFLCLFLVGHLLGNMQLVLKTGEEGRKAFNEYAYFMTHNPFIIVLSYLTYFSILFHAIDGILLTIQNKKARPVNYAYNRPDKNSSSASRYMAILGSAILIFIVVHMANFWWAMKHSSEPMPLHKVHKTLEVPVGQNPLTGEVEMGNIEVDYLLTTKGEYKEFSYINPNTNEKEEIFDVKNETEFIDKKSNLKLGEGYKDLHSQVMSFFGQDKSKEGFEANDKALIAVLLYVVSMFILGFHLWHGFQSSFQSLGINHKTYTPAIKFIGKAFAVLISLAFALIPVLIFMNK